MEEEEPIRTVKLIELVDPLLRGVDERAVCWLSRVTGIGEVREQREVQVRIPVREESHFQIVEQ